MRILFLCEGKTVPASRFRVEQFLPYFEREGVTCTIRHAYGEGYNSITRTPFSSAYKLLQRLKLAALTHDAVKFDIVFCQRPVIPQSSFTEWSLARMNPNTIFDFDDAVWLGPGGSKSARRRAAFVSIAKSSAHLIAGNAFLAAEADFPQKTSIIPTVIDTERYTPAPASRTPTTVIGWMGTKGNFPFLEELVPCLRRVLRRHPTLRLRLVSNAEFTSLRGHPQVEQLAWSENQELDHLRSFDIGLMPLVSSEQTRGKCAFKMITYMAVATPVVASAVGANIDVFDGSGAGFLQDSFDWDDALSTLIEDETLRREMGGAGRARVVGSYSVEVVLPRYLEIFERVANS